MFLFPFLKRNNEIRDARSVMDAKSVAWGVDSDHRAIMMRMRIRRTIWRPPVFGEN